jgi:hypothetical protein
MAEPERGGAQAFVGGVGHGGEQLERRRVLRQGPAHRLLVEHPDLGADLGEAGMTGKLTPPYRLALGLSRLRRIGVGTLGPPAGR